jgi:hypothetical protein
MGSKPTPKRFYFVSLAIRVGMGPKRRSVSCAVAPPVASANRSERSATASGPTIDVDVGLDESPVPATPDPRTPSGAPDSGVIDGPEERMHIDRAFQKVSAAVAGKTVTTYVCCAQVYEYKREDDGTTVQSTRPCGVLCGMLCGINEALR